VITLLVVAAVLLALATGTWATLRLWRATARARRPFEMPHTEGDIFTRYGRLLGLPQKRNRVPKTAPRRKP
jgi:hypothetical protein